MLKYVGGSGGSSPPVVPAYVSASVHLTPWLPTTPAPGAVVINTLYLSPVIVGHRRTFTGAAINVTTLAVGAARIGIYASQADGRPGDILIEPTTSVQLDIGIAGIRNTAAYSLDLPPGLYWLGVVFDSTPSVSCFNAGNYAGAVFSTGAISALRGTTTPFVYGPLASLASVSPVGSGGFVPIIGIR